VVQRDDSSPELSVACYAKASLATGTASIVTPSLGNPVKACAALWAAGDFGTTNVPGLDACVLPGGAPAVFPGESGSVCDRLGLKQLETSDYARRVGMFTA